MTALFKKRADDDDDFTAWLDGFGTDDGWAWDDPAEADLSSGSGDGDQAQVFASMGATAAAKGGNKGKPPPKDEEPTDPPPDDPPPDEGGVVTSYTSGDTDSGNTDYYNIDINFVGDDWTAALQQAFIDAADFMSDLINSGFADDPSVPDTSTKNPRDTVEIDDLLIHAELKPIDGPGGTLGRAGPEYAHDAIDWIPIEGTMQFDIADAQNFYDDGYWGEIVMHEMLHVMGFGGLWDEAYMDLTTVVDGTLVFNGDYTVANYGYVVIEEDYGPGTAFSHWDEAEYEFALMSGFISENSGGDMMKLMDFSVSALYDMGYDIEIADIRDYDISGIGDYSV